MEKSTVLGLAAGLVLIFATAASGGDWSLFLNLPSAVIVLGGSAVALLLSFTTAELRQVAPALRQFLGYREPDLAALAPEFYEYSRIAHRDGLLALDRHLSEREHSLSRFGLELAIDGIDEHHVGDMVHIRIAEQTRRLRLLAKFFASAGAYAPAFGMIGTLFGLIQMLHHMNAPGVIGPAMSVAMVTTFYGAVLANLIFLPMAAKVRAQIANHQKEGEMIRYGVLAVLRGESPSMVERRLHSFVDRDAAEAPLREAELQLATAA